MHCFSRKKQPQKLQTKLFKYYLLMPLLILACFSFFFYFYVSNILIHREQQSLKTREDTIYNAVYKKLNDMDQISTNINYFNRKINFLTKDGASDSLTEYIISLNGTVMKADQINIYDLNGHVTEIGNITKSSTYNREDLPWFDKVLEYNGRKLISVPYQTKRYSPGNQQPDWYISLYRTAFNSHKEVIGVIETVKRCKNMFSDISSYMRKEDNAARIYVFNDDGEQIYPYENESAESDQAYFQLIKDLQNSKDEIPDSIVDPITGEKCRFVMQSSHYSGWNYLMLQNDHVTLRPVNQMQEVLFFIVVFMVGISVLLSLLLARNMVKPVKHLKHIIQRVQLDTLGQENVADYHVPYEELNEVYVEFEKMNDSLKHSLAELDHSRNLELKSRVTALQVQMNPHFYYNTLSCISILAENGQTEEVTRLCQTLSMIMRYITDTEAIVISVQDEMDYIEKYLYCMKIRYEDSLNFTIKIPDEILKQSIPKLIIQPLVENAIKYGTNCLPPWHLSIEGEWSEEQWTVTVTDSGNGFEEEVLKNLNEKITAVNKIGASISSGLKIGGLGLMNVYIRWKLYCKEDAIFSFGNTPDGHAYITIGRKQ